MAQALMGLGLTDAQKSQIRDIMSAARKDNANADPATRRANYKAAFEKIDTILTPEQRTQLHAKLAELRKERLQGAASQS
jgi:Spy/CpxP family protein refolding chaperone